MERWLSAMIDRIPLLIAVTDLGRLSQTPEAWASTLLGAGVDIVQVREPGLSTDAVRELTQRLLDVAPSHDRVQVNTYVDIAGELGCGVHLPERAGVERPPLVPASRSVHSLKSARASGAFDFAIAGHIFATPSKPGLEPKGTEWLTAVVTASPVPIIAIGGITASNAAEVIRAGASGIAAISALTGADDPFTAAHQLRITIDHAWKDRLMDASPAVIEITLNGKRAGVPRGSTILDLLNEKELAERLVVVERNGAIVPKSSFAETVFSAGDQVEIVHFVGGGCQVDR